MKHLTFEEFVNKAKKIHGEDYIYEFDLYKNTKSKIWVTHKKCGNRFLQTPKNILQGNNCPICRYIYTNKHNNFIKNAEKRFGDKYSFPYIEKEYKNSHSKITIKCNKCGKIFTKIACDFITSKYGGCNCEQEKDKYIDYDELLKYTDTHQLVPFDGFKKKSYVSKVELICPTHGIYTKFLRDVLHGNCECQKCSRIKGIKNNIKTVDEVEKKIITKYPHIIIYNKKEYKNLSTPLTFKCVKCGYIFKRKPTDFLNLKFKDACPNCAKNIIANEHTKTTEQYKLDVKHMYGETAYTVIGNYIASDKKIEIKCNKCGRIFSIEANSFLQGHGCPYHNCNSSIKEKELLDFIKSLTNDTISNDRNIINPYELDIVVPSKKIAFEYDGLFWHSEVKKDKDYHLLKTEKCIENDYRLIHIFEDEWLNKSDIWKSMIRNIFGMTINKVYARNCIIKKINTKECTTFLEKNHIQGWCPSQIKIGLYYNNELVSLMTFGKSRHFIGNSKTEYELLRFCNKLNTNVVGGASKLLKYFIKEFNPSSIITYADRRWSNGNLYNKLGFKYSHNSKPNYYYIIGATRKNRFNFRKSVLIKKYNCPLNISEKEFCKQQKWYRIYDCGTMVFKWFKEN